MKKLLLIGLALSFFSLLSAQDWEVVKMGFMDYYPNSGYAFNMDTLMFVGEDGVVMRTDNGGEDGYMVREPEGNSWTSVDFANDMVGFACAGEGKIYKTVDGGFSWTQVGDTVNYNVSLKNISVVSEDTIFVGGASSTVLRSFDGGVTWQDVGYTFEAGGKVHDIDGGVAFANGRVGVVAADY